MEAKARVRYYPSFLVIESVVLTLQYEGNGVEYR